MCSFSQISKEWRVVASFVEHNPDMIQSSAPVFESQPRPLTFDGRQHKSLNPELKYLYTAITRAKCNLWIYDSNEDKRLPVFDYWCKRNLVKVVRVDDAKCLFALSLLYAMIRNEGLAQRVKRILVVVSF